jgi:hypothetical protein
MLSQVIRYKYSSSDLATQCQVCQYAAHLQFLTVFLYTRIRYIQKVNHIIQDYQKINLGGT